MAINFTRLATGWGKLVGALNEVNTFLATTIVARGTSLRAAITVDPDLNSGLKVSQDSLTSGASSWPAAMQAKAVALLIAEVTTDAHLADPTVTNCLNELARQMVAGGQSFASSACTATPTQLVGASDATLILDLFDINTGATSDFILPDTLLLTATSPTVVYLLGHKAETATSPIWPGGAGLAGNITVLDIDRGSGDPGFENWTSPTVPRSWAVVTGAVARVTDDPYGVGDGLYVCGIAGGATTRLTQSFPTAVRQRYLLTFWVKKTATGANTGTLSVSLRNAAGVLIGTALTVNQTAITTSWVKYTGVTQVSVVDALSLLDVRYTGGAGDVVSISGVQAITITATYTRGPSVFLLRGLIPIASGDVWKVVLTASGSLTGSLLRGVDRLLGLTSYTATLPTSGSPTQADALVS